mmetsp:Transcript_39933/g.76369  ORF Transcript_39933/g.76369 Transcript_39933/m.76369 type:complete len:259 (+) Transcript_39933:80-856(+)
MNMHTIQNLIDQIRFKPPMFSDPLISKVCSVCYTRNCLMMYRRGQNRKHAVCLPKAERFTLPGLHRCYRVLIVAEQLFHIPPAVTPDGLAHVNRDLVLLVTHVLVGTVHEQQIDNFNMAAHGSPVKGYIVTQVQGIHIGALLDQVLHRLHVTIVRCSSKRRILHQATLLQVSALIHQQFHACQMTVTSSQHKGRVSAVIRLIERGSLCNVFFHPVIVAVNTVTPDVSLLRHEFSRDQIEGHGGRAVLRAGLASCWEHA